jgi:hypothetical protein
MQTAATEATASNTEAPSADSANGEGTAPAAGSPAAKKAELRTKLVTKAAAALVRDDAPAANESEEPKKAKPDPKKPDAKDGKDAKAKDDKEPPKDKPDDKELTKEWRDLRRAKAKHRSEAESFAAQKREAEAFSTRLQSEAELFEKDPIAWLRQRGKNPREVLLRLAREDAEDPKDKLVRETKAKTDELEKKLTEREKKDLEREQTEKAQKAQAKLEAQILEAYEPIADGDDYPLLGQTYEPAHVASLAKDLLLEYFAKTGEELPPEELFARLETALQRREERRKKRSPKSEKADEAGASRTPDRGRASANSDDENLEGDAERKPRRPADVTSRETRLSTTRPTAGESKEALRKRLIRMASERIVS